MFAHLVDFVRIFVSFVYNTLLFGKWSEKGENIYVCDKVSLEWKVAVCVLDGAVVVLLRL